MYRPALWRMDYSPSEVTFYSETHLIVDLCSRYANDSPFAPSVTRYCTVSPALAGARTRQALGRQSHVIAR